MSQANALYTKAQTAAELATKLSAIAAAVFPDKDVQLNVETNVGGIGLGFTANGASLSSNGQMTLFLTQVEKRKHVLSASASINPRHESTSVAYATQDGIVGELRVSSRDDPKRVILLLEAVEKQFNVTTYVDQLKRTQPGLEADALAARERSVADLSETVQKLADLQVDLTKQEAHRREAMQIAIEAARVKQSESLEKEYRARQAILDEKKAEDDAKLAADIKAFHEERAKFQTMEAKFMRRELLKEIKTVLSDSDKMTISDSTAEKRRNIHTACGAVFVLSGGLIITMLLLIGFKATVDWHYFAALASGIVMFASTMIYYLKWNDRWFREHADGEFAAKRYRADILRASWVAELAQEWIKEGKDLPPDLVSAYTRNLFRDIGGSRTTEHPMDHLTSIVKRATEFEIGKNGLSVKGARPGSGLGGNS